MSSIFVDESGDLGFDFSKKGTSKFFSISFLFTESDRSIEKVVKKTFRSLPPHVKKCHSGCLHAVQEKPKIRSQLLTDLARKDISILNILLNKKKVYTKLQDEKQVLYNYVTNILLDRILTKKLVPLNNPITLVASRRETNKFLNDNFRNYLARQARGNHSIDLQVQIKTPFESKGLQAADFISWAIFRYHERQDDRYYNLIQRKIVEEARLFS